MNPSIDLTNSYVMIEKPVAGDWNYTIQYAAKHGHITGLPLTDKQIWIYLYDNNLNTVEEIREDFASVFPDENLDEYKIYEYTFKPKVSNYILHVYLSKINVSMQILFLKRNS